MSLIIKFYNIKLDTLQFYGFNLYLRDRLNHHYTFSNDVTLSISALMIHSYRITLINVTHSNIFTFDIFNKFYNLSLLIYKTFCYHLLIHSFGKIFRVLFIFGS